MHIGPGEGDGVGIGVMDGAGVGEADDGANVTVGADVGDGIGTAVVAHVIAMSVEVVGLARFNIVPSCPIAS